MRLSRGRNAPKESRDVMPYLLPELATPFNPSVSIPVPFTLSATVALLSCCRRGMKRNKLARRTIIPDNFYDIIYFHFFRETGRPKNYEISPS